MQGMIWENIRIISELPNVGKFFECTNIDCVRIDELVWENQRKDSRKINRNLQGCCEIGKLWSCTYSSIEL